MRESPFLSWRAQMPGRPDLDDPEYLDTPFLTAAVNLCTAIGGFIAVATAIYLAGNLHRGFADYWSLILILVIDVAVNVAVRVARARKMRELYPEGRPPSARRVQRGAQPRQVR
ncbi:MAG TPA: hypothetical protein VGF91_19960 [Solirubrobacteraceae bacterium]|jgi:hypothetical protein